MLLFRSEEHVARWRATWKLEDGEMLALPKCWKLAVASHHDRLRPDWRRQTPDETKELFASLELTSDFWRLS